MTFGGTALSNPMKAFTNIEAMALKANKVEGGYVVSGTLPWVSHIAEGQCCGAIAAIDNSDGSRSHEVFFLLDIDDQVKLTKCPEFSGMEGTSTWALNLNEYFVSDAQIIADPARPFIKKIRGAFILLQTGWAMGVTQASIDACREVEVSLGHVNQFLHNRPDELEAELKDLHARIMQLANPRLRKQKSILKTARLLPLKPMELAKIIGELKAPASTESRTTKAISTMKRSWPVANWFSKWGKMLRIGAKINRHGHCRKRVKTASCPFRLSAHQKTRLKIRYLYL